MALFGTLSTGASGLGVSSDNMSVIGDNIANIGTIGFKGSRASFADMLPEYVGGLGKVSTVGRGSTMMGVETMFGQGSLQNSGSAVHMAISGRGFFQVAQGQEQFYTRDGSFHVDAEDYLVTGMGMRVQGYQAIDGQLTSLVGDLQLDSGPIAQQATTQIELNATLSADEPYEAADIELGDGAWFGTPGLDGTSAGLSIEQMSAMADFSTSITVYDSLGVAHDVTVFFDRTGENTYEWSAVVDGGQVDLGGGPDPLNSGYALEIDSGELTFGTDGSLETFGPPRGPARPWNWPGADAFDFDLLVGEDEGGASVDGQITMPGGPSAVTTISQDGYGVGEMVSIQVDAEGILTAQYTNGQEQILGQVALALFPSDVGLGRIGGNLYRSTLHSGAAALGAASTGGRGSVSGYALERSNVELEDEFVNMIQSQRSYQANAGVIRTADESLQVLVNLV